MPHLLVESVEPDLDVSLNGFMNCPVSHVKPKAILVPDCYPALYLQNFDNHISQFYNSTPFLAEAAMAQPFLEELQPFLDNRSIDFTNMVRNCSPP